MALTRSYTISSANNSTVFYSEDFGVTWNNFIQTGIPATPSVTAIAVDPYDPYNLVVSTLNALYKSSDGGQTFTLIPGTSGVSYTDVRYIDSLRLIAVGGVVTLSFDGGQTFNVTSNTPTSLYGSLPPGNSINALFVLSQSGLFISVYDKLFYSTDGGYNWIALNSNLPISAGDTIIDIHCNNNIINAVVNVTGVYRSTDNGDTFSLVFNFPVQGILNGSPFSAATESIFYIVNTSTDLYKSTDIGATWNLVLSNVGGGGSAGIVLHAYSNTQLVILGEFVSYPVPPAAYEILYSVDGGSSFNLGTSGIFRPQAYGTGEQLECSTCPGKYNLNPATGFCEDTLRSLPLCEVGYYYNETNGIKKCINEENPIDTYLVDGCPEGCVTVLGSDARGYCDCVSQVSVADCCYQLNDCTGSAEPIITDTDLSSYYDDGKIIKIQGSDVCWEIEKLEELCNDVPGVIVTESFTSCITCNPSYALYNCKDDTVVVYTAQDLEADLGKTVQVSEYPGECWQVGPNTKTEFVPEVVTITEEFQSCLECNPTVYQLNNCFNDESFILTDSNIADLIGKTISIVGYPGLCFTITAPTCKCIKATIVIDDVTNTLELIASQNLINGRNQYVFEIGLISYFIAWNSTELRWELYNSTSGTLLAYSPINLECIYTSYWVVVAGIDSIVTESCSTTLYNIVVDEVYPNCDCCTTKNCK